MNADIGLITCSHPATSLLMDPWRIHLEAENPVPQDDQVLHGDLAKLVGWNFLQMLSPYAASAATGRAKQARRRLGLGKDL